MQIINLRKVNKKQIEQAIIILKDSFPIWLPTLQDAKEAVDECLAIENTMLTTVENNVVIGWGGILAPEYNGNVFELHPLVVRYDRRKQGIGKMIVTALEEEARKQGGKTIHLGADDEKAGGETSLANMDLYDNLSDKIKNFTPGTHQSGFYMKLGYKIIGVMPDANGYGKPDIYFGKRL